MRFYTYKKGNAEEGHKTFGSSTFEPIVVGTQGFHSLR